MKRLICILLALGFAVSAGAYYDHRGENLDSLERVVAGWTPERMMTASEKESQDLCFACHGLMRGYLQINSERSMLFARRCYQIAQRWNWLGKMQESSAEIALVYYGVEQYDSALHYYNLSLSIADRMAAGETWFNGGEPYAQDQVDDAYSSLYGAIGNLYNMMDSIPKAMEYYRKAGEIFTKYGWNESNAILWYNMGETWYEAGDLDQAHECYKKSLSYAKASGDSLQISTAYKGLGTYYLAKGKTGRALRYISQADEYYSLHQDQEFRSRIETLDLTNQILARQKRLWRWVALGATVLIALLVALGLILRRNRKLSLEKEGADIVIEQALAETPAAEDLTDREREILPLLAAGLTSTQIADKMCLSLPTIKWYRKRLLEKFNVSNTAELISRAKEQGVL
jgi:DNA-binding CsgD family transcriptional regulator